MDCFRDVCGAIDHPAKNAVVEESTADRASSIVTTLQKNIGVFFIVVAIGERSDGKIIVYCRRTLLIVDVDPPLLIVFVLIIANGCGRRPQIEVRKESRSIC